MPTTVSVSFNTQQILNSRGLGQDKRAQKFFTNEVKRFSDPYTPMDSGMLKSNVSMSSDSITYSSPYARYQYYGISKNGKVFNYAGAPMRGSKWDKRMWSDRGSEIMKSVADLVGGKVK